MLPFINLLNSLYFMMNKILENYDRSRLVGTQVATLRKYNNDKDSIC